MTRKTLLAAALAAGSLVGAVSVAHAVPAVVAPPGTYAPGTAVYSYPGQAVIVQPAPPAPLVEQVPAPREGYVWTPGHFEWRNGQYAWIPGEWMSARPGFAWRSPRWQQQPDGSWLLMAGEWVRTDDYAYADRRGPLGDRDGDGVLNRDDNYPRDPTRY
jgi:hypothetical protein